MRSHMTATGKARTEATLTPPSEGQPLVVKRDLDAPRDLVWEAWTRAEHFALWFGPHGTTLPYCVLDARPGGRLRFQHRHANGEDVWVAGTFLEVERPERLAFRVNFTDPSGDTTERPGFPSEMLITVTLEEAEGGTRVTIRQDGLTRDQGEGRGWIEALERLLDHLDDTRESL
jgi:uncharacterized protein YndB with AHSA1/START domain